jgi:hypothetical protein
VNRQLKIFWWGFVLYLVSFFLVAVHEPGVSYFQALTGFVCAYLTLASSLPRSIAELLVGGGWDGGHLYSFWISGWINPVFLFTAFLELSGQYPKTVKALRIVVLLMIPFCWLVYAEYRFWPREGHVVWIMGMTVVLFSRELDWMWSRLRGTQPG